MATTSNAAMRKKTLFYVALFTTQTTRAAGHAGRPAEIRQRLNKKEIALMAQSARPPFRADYVGSLLRASELHEAREKAAKTIGVGVAGCSDLATRSVGPGGEQRL